MDIAQWIDENASIFIQASDQIWEAAEIKFQEARSAKVLEDALEKAGFIVERGVAEMPTAFVASYGNGKPVIAVLGEYDALPGLSQEKLPYRKARVTGAAGHGCGHNLLGSGSLAAVMAVAQAIRAGDVHGTVRYYGCPAEEGGSGKGYMVKAGLFNDVDLALSWHPQDTNVAASINLLAVIQAYFRFHGKTAHAAADPYNGRSALDAVELMNIGTNYLREHMIPEARIHYIITKGGSAANVVPDLAESHYMVRAPEMSEAKELFERVKAVAQGAALMTGTQLEVIFDAGFSNMILNTTIDDVFYEKLVQIGAPQLNPEEKEFAQEIAKTLPGGTGLEGLARLLGGNANKIVNQLKGKVYCDIVLPRIISQAAMPGSSDVGDVSWVTPTGQLGTACSILGTPGHSWQQVAQGSMGIGYKGLLYAGKVMAAAAIEFMQHPELVEKARAEFEEHTKGKTYQSPIPDEVKPPVF